MAQHASPKLAGHELRARAHLTRSSMRLVMTLCVIPARPSWRMSSISPTADLLRSFLGRLGRGRAALGADLADRRGQRALRADLAGIGGAGGRRGGGGGGGAAGGGAPGGRPRGGPLEDEGQEEQHREDQDGDE